jgi:hypothetical protein
VKKFEITLKDLSKYRNTGERKVVVEAVNEGTAITVATQSFKEYEMVGFAELGIETEEETHEDNCH